MVGRFAGSWLLTRIKAPHLLAVFATMTVVLCVVVSQTHGSTAAYAALSIGLFNSIMFPVIFTVTLERSTAIGGRVGASVLVDRWRRDSRRSSAIAAEGLHAAYFCQPPATP